MYHCHIRFLLLGSQNKMFEQIKQAAPMEHFAHDFLENAVIDEPMVSSADVILACLSGMDVSATVPLLVSGKKREAQLIVLAEKEQMDALTDALPEIHDIWTLPMNESELQFRFLRWQQSFKTQKDYWETSQYLESTINSVPNLIWYKTKDGIHEKVNDSFCETVNKTKAQVQGRGHAYIWDVEHDDPACIESELEVMTRQETCVSEEVVQTSSGTRLLTTYKSPLYDLDGSVMGTVGVGIDITQEKEYKQQLISKSQTLESIFTTMDCGILCHSVDGTKILSINKAALRILGYESQEALLADGFHIIASSVMDEDQETPHAKFLRHVT